MLQFMCLCTSKTCKSHIHVLITLCEPCKYKLYRRLFNEVPPILRLPEQVPASSVSNNNSVLEGSGALRVSGCFREEEEEEEEVCTS